MTRAPASSRQIQVQVGARRGSLVSAQGDDLSLPHGKLSGRERQVAHERFVGILVCAHRLLYGRGERDDVPIYGGQPVGVVHVDHLPVSPVEHRHARHIPGGHAPHGLARHALRLDVDSVMEMVRPQLPEVRAQQQGEVEGRSETVFGRMLLRPSAQCGEERKRQCKFAHHSSIPFRRISYPTIHQATPPPF